MSRRRVTLDEFSGTIKEIVNDYADGVYATQSKAVTAATKQALREVRAGSSQFSSKYAGGWRSRVERTNITATGICYNNRPGLPHLLEFGHALPRSKKSKRTAARRHVLPAQNAVNKVLMKRLVEGLSK